MNLVEIFTIATLVISVLVMTVSLITQVIKGVGIFKKIPTDLLVMILSIAITVTAFLAYVEYMKYPLLWYMIVAAVILGFFVAFVAMFGWERVASLWTRYKFNRELFEDEEEDFDILEDSTPGETK